MHLPDVATVRLGRRLAVALLALVGLTAAAERAGLRRRAWVAWPLGLVWTLWWCELLLSAWWWTRPPVHAPTPGGHAELVAADGTRVRAELGPLPEGPTVLVLGDSFTIGQGVPLEQTFGALTAQALAPDGVRVVVQAVEGASFFDLVVRYAAFGAPLDPDVVVWTWVLNDLSYASLGREIDEQDYISDRRRLGWPLVLGLPALARRNAALEAATERATLDAFAPERPAVVEAGRAMAAAAAEARARGARFVVLVFPLLHRLDAYPFGPAHTRIRALAEAAGAEVLDLGPTFAGLDARTLWVNRLDHHPNARGHQLAADALVPFLRAGGVPDSGPTDCAAIGVVPALEDVLRAACATRTPEALRTLAAAVAALPADADVSTPLDRAGLVEVLEAVARYRAAGPATP